MSSDDSLKSKTPAPLPPDMEPRAGSEADLDPSGRESSFTRRALINAGWSVPVVIALEAALPKTVSAGSTFCNGGYFKNG